MSASSRRLLGVTLALATTALASCAPGSGPLDHGPGDGRLCTPVDADGYATIASDAFDNTGSAPAQVTDVRLKDATGLTISAWEAHQADSTVQVNGRGRMRVPDVQSVPADGGQVLLLTVELRSDDPTTGASYEALEVEYTVGRRTYTTVTSTSVTLQPAGTVCS